MLYAVEQVPGSGAVVDARLTAPARGCSAACQAEIEASWERIFGLRWTPEFGGWSHSGIVHAVVREVPLRSVVRVTPFVAG